MKIEVIACQNFYHSNLFEWNITKDYNEEMYEKIINECSQYSTNNSHAYFRAKIKFTFENDIIFTLYLENPINNEWVKLYNGENISMKDEFFDTHILSEDGIIKFIKETDELNALSFSIPLDKFKPYIENFIEILKKIIKH
jgi:hypothetical protein